MKKKTVILASVFFVCVLIIIGILAELKIMLPKNNSISYDEYIEPVPAPSIITKSTVSIMAAGDNLIHDSIYNQAAKRANYSGYNFYPVYENVSSFIKDADISILNQETPLASKIAPVSTYPMFNSPTELGDTMIDLGFDVMNHANNHILDKGTRGIIATLDYYDSKKDSGVIYCGAYRDEDDLQNIRTLTKNNITFSFLGFTEHTNGLSLPSDSKEQIIYTTESDRIKAQIEAARKVSDVVVVSVHWGVEGTHSLSEHQMSLARDMAEWGADIIIGTHPHVLQPIEYITASDGTETLVAYSLGNFVSAQSAPANLLGGFLNVNVTKIFPSGEISLSDAAITPVVTHYGYGYSDIKLYTLGEYTDQLAASHGIRGRYPAFSLNYINSTLSSVIDENFMK